MKTIFTWLSVIGLLLGCKAGELATAVENAGIEVEKEVANGLYLEDVLAVQEQEDVPGQASDPSAAEDVKPERLEEMAHMMLPKLDTDQDGQLSLAEFLAWIDRRPRFSRETEEGAKPAISEEKKQKIRERMTATFEKFADAHKMLARDQIPALLKSLGGPIGRMRHRELKEMGIPREQRHAERKRQIEAQFDSNGDGMVDASERAEMQRAWKFKRRGHSE